MEFQNGCMTAIFDIRAKLFSNSDSQRYPDGGCQVLVQSSMIQKEMLFEDFQDICGSGHNSYRNGTILTILNIHAALMPPTKLRFNPPGNVVWSILRWPPF